MIRVCNVQSGLFYKFWFWMCLHIKPREPGCGVNMYLGAKMFGSPCLLVRGAKRLVGA